MSLFPDFSTFIKIGNFSIQWYAICILIGAFIAYQLGRYRFKEEGYDPEILSDYFINVLLIGILGARIWYVLFMLDYYLANPQEIIAIWHGGLAIQGGLFAGLIYSYYFFKKRNVPFLVAGDCIMPGVLIAQAMGRWGNFFNHEAYGSAVSLNFLKSLHLPSFIINNMYIEGAYHHPTFLYESLGNVIIFCIIFFIIRKYAKYNGQQFFAYFIGYGILRIFVEGLRTDSLMLGPLRIAQVISIIFIVLGILGEVYCIKKGSRRS